MNARTVIGSTSLGFMAAAAAVVATGWAQQRDADYPTADTTLAEWLEDKDARLSELVGTRVMTPAGTDVGEVEDLLATPGRDQNPVVVLSIGGFLDIADKHHGASLHQLRFAADAERLVLDATEGELEAAPDFEYTPTIGEESHQPGVRGPSTTNSIGRLLGATVVDSSGESIGEIDDFVVSTGERGTRAVVDLDDDVGPRAEGRLVAVPLEELHIELSGEEAAGVPQMARVRVELDGSPVEALPAYTYPDDGAI